MALWVARDQGRLRVVPLAETLGRQTGMYRYARTISEGGAAALTDRQCRQGCLRVPLWAGAGAVEGDGSRERVIPVWCPEACSLYVAEARLVAKAEFEAKAHAGEGAGKDGA
jgi:sirohydrochlorin cobaltochelatase